MVGWPRGQFESPDLHSGLRCFPRGFLFPIFPVYKKSKQDLRDVVINDGLHMHGIGVANRLGRISESLDVHFAERLDEYLTSNLRHIDVEPITHMAKYVTSYAMKGLKRPMFSPGSDSGAAKDARGIAGPKPTFGLMSRKNSSSEHFPDPFGSQ